MELSDYLRAYEEQHKKPPTQAAVRFTAWLNDAGKKFGRIGFGDGHHHKQPLDDSVFSDWARRYFADDAEMVELCADFVRGCYHDGLAEGRAIA